MAQIRGPNLLPLALARTPPNPVDDTTLDAEFLRPTTPTLLLLPPREPFGLKLLFDDEARTSSKLGARGANVALTLHRSIVSDSPAAGHVDRPLHSKAFDGKWNDSESFCCMRVGVSRLESVASHWICSSPSRQSPIAIHTWPRPSTSSSCLPPRDGSTRLYPMHQWRGDQCIFDFRRHSLTW